MKIALHLPGSGRAAPAEDRRPLQHSTLPVPLLWTISWLGVPILLMILLLSFGCAGSNPDPRSRIDAEGEHRARLAKLINGSKLWQAYFDQVDPSGARGVTEFRLVNERKKFRSRGGDYDPGEVTIVFEITNITNGSRLFAKEVDVQLQSFMVGVFDEDMTKDEIQELAFKAAEKKVYPYIEHWMDVAAVRAMGEEGDYGTAFIPVLDELVADKWVQAEVRGEARKALQEIRGRG